MNSFYSLHILADGCDENDINRAGRFLAACECDYYHLTAAARYNESEKIIRLLRYQAPKARPIWRGWPGAAFEDGGIWKRMRPQEWVNYRVALNWKWLQELGVLVLPCNEVGTLGSDTRLYSNWEADAIRLAYIQFDVNLAVLRLSTGNPLETEHDNYNSLLQAASEYDAVLSFNEYTSTRMEITNKWHVGRYKWAWAQQDKLGVKRSPIVIGEYGVCRVNPDNSLDPNRGYVDQNVNVNDHVSIIKRDGLTYQPDGVTVCGFTFGKWQQGGGTFDIQHNEPLLSAVEIEAKAGHLATIKQQANVVTKPLPALPDAPQTNGNTSAPMDIPKPLPEPPKTPQMPTSRDLTASQIGMLEMWRGQLQFEIKKHQAEIDMCTERLAFIDRVYEVQPIGV